ncbi:MAG: endonuclease/exonuclease/phosphatase family protein [Bacteroidetes bacterium]|nr:endonuclease/exonuclease/phosphatase family protein [Bacteroidota bacterium]MBS1540455.1 endonuclease/exonuclease/phosphatase family protein [Bacteroidota bacterium]
MIVALAAQAQTYKVATYNLRFDNPNDVGNLWKDRMPSVASLIRYHDFDVFGTQEGQPHQLHDLTNALPQYVRYGIGRDNGSDQGEHAAIFYKKDKFNVLTFGDFWLSQTPDKPGLGWDATCCNRICSWVLLQDKKSDLKFYFFNTHLDHQGKVARAEGSKLILQKIKEIAREAPVILTGDFNAGRADEPYKILAQSALIHDSHADVKYPYENNTSFNGFDPHFQGTEIIDHIFISKQFTAYKWGLLTDTYFGKFPSDHFPVEAVVSMGSKE